MADLPTIPNGAATPTGICYQNESGLRVHWYGAGDLCQCGERPSVVRASDTRTGAGGRLGDVDYG